MARFQPGNNGGPGRPKGSRNKLQEKFWEDFVAAWEASGAEALKKVAAEEPGTFVRVAASLMPKEIEAKLSPLTQMSDDDLRELIESARQILASEAAPDTGSGAEAETRH